MSMSTPSRSCAVRNVSRLLTSAGTFPAFLNCAMTVWSPPPPPSEARTLVPAACAAVTSAATSLSEAPMSQSLFPLAVAKARFRWVILAKSIDAAQVA